MNGEPGEIPSDVRQCLEEAKEALRMQGWTQHEYARDEGGVGIDARSENAVAFCMIGVLAHVTKSPPDALTATGLAAMELLEAAVGESSLDTWNDVGSRTREEVLAAFDAALEGRHYYGDDDADADEDEEEE